MGKNVVAVSVAVVLIALINPIAQATPVNSAFDTGLDGWTLTSVSIGGITWQPTGGNPGGYVRYQDGPGVGSRIIAPPKFLGDWSSLDEVGVVSYDHRIFDVGTNPVFHYQGIEIFGPGGSAEWRGPAKTGVTDWPTPPDHTVVAPLRASEWSVVDGSWSALLADVTEFRIVIEGAENVYVPGPPWFGDITGLDNVYLGPRCIPTPGALLLTLAGVGLVSRFRKPTRTS